MYKQLEFTLFGNPEVRLNGEKITGFRSGKAQALLYYLAVTGRAHARPTLTALLWGDQPEAAARVSLSKCLSNLHDLVGDAVLIERQNVAINRDHPYLLDTERLEATIGISPTLETISAFQSLLALYRGDFLEGFYVRDAPDFEQWQLLQRAHYREAVVNVLYVLASYMDQQDDLPGAIVLTRRLLLLEPWREEAHRHLMILLARNGQRGAALAQYESCLQILANELAVEPDGETLATLEAIRRGAFDQVLGEPSDKRQKNVRRAIPKPNSTFQHRVDWGEAPDVSRFHGRQAEVDKLRQWLVDDQCRLVAVLGIGGIGKTALATMVAELVENQFSTVLWRSLRNAPPPVELFGQCIQGMALDGAIELPHSTEGRLALLMEQLRQQRCLLILDNVETVLESERAGHYLPGYEGYGQLLQQVAQARHQSCLLLTSREKPRELVPFAGEDATVRTLPLTSLSPEDGRLLLHDRGLWGSGNEWMALHERYSGNPLALQIVSESIRELFAGDIAQFLRQETILFGGIADLLAHQFARLSALEQEVMLWLTVAREKAGPEELREDIARSPNQLRLLEALHSLRQRSLVERVEGGFTVQNVVLEYLTELLVEQINQEITHGQTIFLQRYALLKAGAKNYVRESQRNLILAPIAHRLVEQLDRPGAVERLRSHLSKLRDTQRHQPGYAGGNLLNLLVYLGGQLRGLDCSQLAVWQADLRGVDAQGLDFRHSDLSTSIFSDTFAAPLVVVFSPDGDRVAAGTIGSDVRVWSVNNGQPLLTCTGHSNHIEALCFSYDGAMLASAGGDQTVRLWNMQDGQGLALLRGHTNVVNTICLSPDGCILASGSGDHTIRLWETSTWQCLMTLHGHMEGVNSICFSPDGYILASGSRDHTIQVWEVASGKVLTTLKLHTDIVYSVCFNPAGSLLASSSRDGTVRLWNPLTWQCQATWSHTSPLQSISFSPDGEMLAGGSIDQAVRLWNTQSGQPLGILQGHTNEVNSVSFSPNGALLASGSWDQSVRLWNVTSRQCVAILQGYKNEVKRVCFSPVGSAGRYYLASASTNGEICLWDGESRHFLNRWQGHSSIIEAICFSPADVEGACFLASCGDDQTVRVWELPSGRCLTTLREHSNDVYAVCFSRDGRTLASAGWDQTVRLWDTSSWQCIAKLHGHTQAVRSLCMSPDGRLLASSGDDQTVRLWDISSWQCLLTLQGHRHSVGTICFSPDGHTLASGSWDRTIRLWDVASGHSLATLQSDLGTIGSIDFSPDGTTLASSGQNQSVSLWDVPSGLHLVNLHGHLNSVLSVSFSPDGRVLASGSADETIRLWDVQSREWFDMLRSERPYEGMNITGATGLTEAQRAALMALGAISNG